MDSKDVVQQLATQVGMTAIFDSLGRKADDGNVRERIAIIETTLKSLATKGDVERMRNEMQESVLAISNDLKKWTLATSWTVIAVGVIGLFGLLFTIYNANKQDPRLGSQAPIQPAPIVIQVPAPPPPAQPPADPAKQP